MKLKIPSFRDVSVLVIGDVMLDRYWYGKAGRVSQEAPVPIVDIESSDDRPGGAANVAMNLASLGLNVTLIGVVGDDDAAATLRHKLAAAHIRCELIDAAGWPTILKVRVVSRRQQMLRIDFEKPILADVESRLDDAFRRHISTADAVVIEDYDKGTLARPQRYIDIAHEHGKRVVVDPKFKPLEAYRSADVIKPNIAEFTHAVGGWADYRELVSKAAALVQTHDFGALVVTRGDEGMSVIERNGAHHHVPARTVDVFDETGAGDTVAATLAAGLAAGCTVHESAMLANAAAGLVVAKSGTATVSAPELRRELRVEGHADRGTQSGTLSREELIEAVEQARRDGERVVFTNGCFDILHAGHVAYLEEARSLGDRLIVAVNDDASVARLKGEGRPVNGVAQRMRVLGALASVDWTVSFGEDTPEALLEAIKPDVLVKGGDYRLGEVVGADIVRRHGGEVRVLAHVPNLSTSSILDSLKQTGN